MKYITSYQAGRVSQLAVCPLFFIYSINMFVFFVLETVMEYTFKFGGKKTDPVFQKLFDFLFLERGCYQLICFEIFRHSLSYKIVMQGFLEIHM